MSSLALTICSQCFDTIAASLFIPVIQKRVVNHIGDPTFNLQSFIHRGFIVPTIIGGPSDLKRILIRVFATDYRLGTLQLTRSGQENRGFMDGRPRNGRWKKMGPKKSMSTINVNQGRRQTRPYYLELAKSRLGRGKNGFSPPVKFSQLTAAATAMALAAAVAMAAPSMGISTWLSPIKAMAGSS